MPRRRPLALLLSLAALAIIAYPSTSAAITLHRHIIISRPNGPPREVVRVVTVAPPDSDDDGCADPKDHYNGPGCDKPAPAPAPKVSSVSQSVAPAPVSVPPVPATTSGGCPSYMSGEASSPDAVNPSSGAAGCYQVLPSTAAAMGPACADVNATSCVAAICASAGNAAWAASGSTPCDYLKP